MSANLDDYVRKATATFERRLGVLVDRYRAEGRSPLEVLGDPDALAERAIAAEVPDPSHWDALVGPFVRTDGVQARLRITRQAVATRAARRRLLRVWTSDGVALFPLWQFAGQGLVAGLADVMVLFPEAAVDGWTLAGWLRTPDTELGAVPFDAVVAGETSRVVAVARSAAAALAA